MLLSTRFSPLIDLSRYGQWIDGWIERNSSFYLKRERTTNTAVDIHETKKERYLGRHPPVT